MNKGNQFLSQDVDMFQWISNQGGTASQPYMDDAAILPGYTWSDEGEIPEWDAAIFQNITTEISPEELGNELPQEDQEAGEPEILEDGTDEGSADLDEILNSINEEAMVSSEADANAATHVDNAKEAVEELQALEETPEEKAILQDLYEDLLITESNLQATEVAKNVLMWKVTELQTKLSWLEADNAGKSIDNPDLMLIQGSIDAAYSWDEAAMKATKDWLQKIYTSLFGASIEEDQVNSNLQESEWDIQFSEWTSIPQIPQAPEKEWDPNDITSILG